MKIATARMKFAIGPAATMAARLRDALVREADLALLRRQAFERLLVGHARRVGIAHELDIAAERNCRELPARPVPVGPAEYLRVQTRSRTQLRRRRSAVLPRNVRTRGRTRRPSKPARNAITVYKNEPVAPPIVLTRSITSSSRARLGRRGRCHAGKSEPAANLASWSIASASSTVAGTGRDRLAERARTHGLDSLRYAIESDPPAMKASTAISFAALSTVGIAPPSRSAARARAETRKSRLVRRFET